MLKLKLHYFGHLLQRLNSFEKTRMLGKIEGRRRSDWQRTRWLDDITNSMDINLSKPQELVMPARPGVLQSMGLHGVGHNWATELNWTELLKSKSVYKSPLTQWVKNPSAMQETHETWLRSLGWEYPLEKMVTLSRILALEIPWTEEPAGLQFRGWRRVRQDWVTLHEHECVLKIG